MVGYVTTRIEMSNQNSTDINTRPSGGVTHTDGGLPKEGDERVEPKPPSCEQDTSYLGYRGCFAFHKCDCCGRIYAVDAFENTKQFQRDNGVLVLRDTKTHAQIASTVSMRVRP